MTAYYNEFDPFAAQWLRNLIEAGLIAPGIVDERSITDVSASDLKGFKQCHFFAGIGVWSLSLRRAGWADNREVWTGSCPCQPFSAAGKGNAFEDERHLWPKFYELISQRKPPVVFGEQVASKDGLNWFDLVSADLERSGYAVGAADLCAAGVGAPHIRQRLYWVGYADNPRLEKWGDRPDQFVGQEGWEVTQRLAGLPSVFGNLADSDSQLDNGSGAFWQGRGAEPTDSRSTQRMADSGDCKRKFEQNSERSGVQSPLLGAPTGWDRLGINSSSVCVGGQSLPSPTNGHWGAADWLGCRDGKWRPVEPGTFPLAHGATGRVGRLRAYGNAITPQQAETFIRASVEAITDALYHRKRVIDFDAMLESGDI